MPEDKMVEIEKVEQIAARGGGNKPGREGLVLPPAERAEQLWGLFNEYSALRRSLYREGLSLQKGGREVKSVSADEKKLVLAHLGETPPNPTKQKLLHRLEGEVANLWEDPQVKSVFISRVKEAKQEKAAHAPSVRRYRELNAQSTNLEEEYFDLLRNQFLMRQTTPTLRAMDIARNRAEKEVVKTQTEDLETNGGMPQSEREERHGLDRQHADLVALLAYERARDYHRQFKKDGIIFTPSRENLLEKVLEKTSRGTWMQLVGETGTGKTTFAKRASWVLNDEPAQYASGEKWGDVRVLIGTKTMDPTTGRVYYEFGPLTASLTGYQNSLEMDEAIKNGTEAPGKLLILDELNKFDQDALFGALKLPATLQPGEVFNFKELPGVKLRMARKGVAIITTMNPATVRYERKELDPALDRLFYDGKEKVDYPPMSPQSPELYEIFLGILMDDNGRIRISKDELAPHFIEVEDGATGLIRQELDQDPTRHGTLYKFTMAASEIQKSFTQKDSVAKTATDPGFLEKTGLEMETLVKWIKGYSAEIEGGASLTTYLEKKLHDFYGNIDNTNDKVIYERVFSHFGFNIANPIERPKPAYSPLTPVEMGYLTPKTLREVRRIGEEAVPRTKIYVDPVTGEETSYLPMPHPEGAEVLPGTVFESEDSDQQYIYLGTNPETGDAIVKPLNKEE